MATAIVNARIHPMGPPAWHRPQGGGGDGRPGGEGPGGMAGSGGMGGEDDGAPWLSTASAILWDGDTILAVGDEEDVRRQARRESAEVVDADGRVVLPGFVDAHMHFLHAGLRGRRPDLRGAASLEDALGRLAAWLRAHPGTDPVTAEGWDESGWPGRPWPSRADVDRVAAGAGQAGRPIVLRRIDGHVAVAGSAALPAVHARWPQRVDRETGVVLEEASLYLNEALPAPPEHLDVALADACRIAHRLGVTAVGDYSQAPFRAALQRAAARGTLSVRVASGIYVQQLDDETGHGFRTGRRGLAPADGPRVRTGGDMAGVAGVTPGCVIPGRDGGPLETGGTSPFLKDGGLKVFLDGSLGAHTAALRDDYEGEKATEEETVREAKTSRTSAGPGLASGPPTAAATPTAAASTPASSGAAPTGAARAGPRRMPSPAPPSPLPPAHASDATPLRPGMPFPGSGHGHGAGRGRLNWSDDDVESIFRRAHAAGIQVHAHAIGDAAIDQGLRAFAKVLEMKATEIEGPVAGQGSSREQGGEWEQGDGGAMAPRYPRRTGPGIGPGIGVGVVPGPGGTGREAGDETQDTGRPASQGQGPSAESGACVKSDLRHRFEHFEIAHDGQMDEARRLGVVASSQPNFVGEWSAKGGMYEARLGRRFLLNNRFRTMKRRGVRLAFGSDGMPFGPLHGIQAATRHPTPGEALEPLEAAWHYTWMAAWSLHWEGQIGSLEPGKKADLVVLSTRRLDLPAEEWGIDQTVVGGRTVHRAAKE